MACHRFVGYMKHASERDSYVIINNDVANTVDHCSSLTASTASISKHEWSFWRNVLAM